MPPLDNTTGTILDALRHHVEMMGEVTAYTFLKSEDERLSITYRELDKRARNIAHGLLQRAEPGDRALMMYPPGLDFIEAFLACLYAGIVAVPAYAPKKNRKAERILWIAEDCTPRLLLCTSETRQHVEGDFAESVVGSSVIVTDELESVEISSLPVPRSDQLAFLQYTSGSTAVPKGVMVTHGNMVANERLIQKYFEFSRDSIMVSWLPMFHDMGLIGGILAPLFVGFPSVLMPPNAFLWQPFRWLQAVSEFRATCTGAPNFAYELCVSHIKPHEKEQLDLSSLCIAYNAAEPVRAETLRRFTEAFAQCGLHQNCFFPCYGMAETTLLVSGGPPLAATNIVTLAQGELEKHRIVETSEGQQIVSCGQISLDLPVRIVDPETLQECAVDKIGEIWVTGNSIADGYLSRPTETAEAFGFAVSGCDEKWFRTGDYGFLRGGELYITGRLKDLIIIRGRNIYPQDIEACVYECFGLESPNSVAAVQLPFDGGTGVGVITEGTQLMYQQSKDWLNKDDETQRPQQEHFRSQVFRLKQLISQRFDVSLSYIAFVKPGRFPRTSSGKVMRSRCQQDFVHGREEYLPLPMASCRLDKGVAE